MYRRQCVESAPPLPLLSRRCWRSPFPRLTETYLWLQRAFVRGPWNSARQTTARMHIIETKRGSLEVVAIRAFRGGGGAGLRVRRRCQAVACDIGGNGTLCRRGRCDLLRRPYCENEKSPIVGALRVRWDSKRISFWSCDRFHATASAPGSSGL